MQIKPTMRHCFSPTRMIRIFKKSGAGEDVGQLGPLSPVVGMCNAALALEISWALPPLLHPSLILARAVFLAIP